MTSRLPLLSRADIEAALRAVAQALPAAASVQITVLGGAAMALVYDARRTTHDVDIVVTSGSRDLLIEAAAKIGHERGLGPRWLSDEVERFVLHPQSGEPVFATDRLVVNAASRGQLLAMKVAAWRDDIDIADARLLLAGIEGDLETVWSQIGGFLLETSRAQARYNFEDLWEAAHGPR